MRQSLALAHTRACLARTWPVLALLVVVAALYWQGRHGGFLLDDRQNLLSNAAVHVTSLDPGAWLAAAFSSSTADLPRPLAMLSFAANHYFTGLDPVPMKLANLAIHLLNTVLAFGLARRVLQAAARAGDANADEARAGERAALFIAAAWALNPINLTPVLYVVQRMESLSHVFVFAGLWLYLALRQHGRALASCAALAACTALGMLAKESAALLPLYAFLAEVFLLRFRDAHGGLQRPVIGAYAVLLLLPAVLGLAWLWPRFASAEAFAHRDFGLGERLLTEARVLVDYLRWTLVPDLSQLSLYHDDYRVSRGLLQPPATLAALLSLAGLATAVWLMRQRAPLAALGIAWFFAAHALTGTVLPLELVHEHRNYFASFGLCLALADLLLLRLRADAPRRIGLVLAVAAVLVYGAATWLRIDEWRDPVRLALAEAARRPDSPRAQFERANTLVALTGFRSDSPLLPAAREALERARDVRGSGILPHQEALVLAARVPGAGIDTALWWNDMRARLRRQRMDSETLATLVALADCAASGGCDFPPEQMVATYATALERGPRPVVLAAYGKYALHVMHDPALARTLWTDAVALDPGHAQLRYNLARLLLQTGQREAAAAQLAELRRRDRFGRAELLARDLEARMQATP